MSHEKNAYTGMIQFVRTMILIYHTPAVTARTSLYVPGWQYILVYAVIGNYRYNDIHVGSLESGGVENPLAKGAWPIFWEHEHLLLSASSELRVKSPSLPSRRPATPCDAHRDYSVALPVVFRIMNALATEDSRNTGEKQSDG